VKIRLKTPPVPGILKTELKTHWFQVWEKNKNKIRIKEI
jgi:predicted alpha/beta hydrolase family esterase